MQLEEIMKRDRALLEAVVQQQASAQVQHRAAYLDAHSAGHAEAQNDTRFSHVRPNPSLPRQAWADAEPSHGATDSAQVQEHSAMDQEGDAGRRADTQREEAEFSKEKAPDALPEERVVEIARLQQALDREKETTHRERERERERDRERARVREHAWQLERQEDAKRHASEMDACKRQNEVERLQEREAHRLQAGEQYLEKCEALEQEKQQMEQRIQELDARLNDAHQQLAAADQGHKSAQAQVRLLQSKLSMLQQDLSHERR
jgi:hypothetical protein